MKIRACTKTYPDGRTSRGGRGLGLLGVEPSLSSMGALESPLVSRGGAGEEPVLAVGGGTHTGGFPHPRPPKHLDPPIPDARVSPATL